MSMKLFLIGASGNVGTRIRHEAIARGHHVTGLTRDAARLPDEPGLTVVIGDVMDRDALAAAVAAHDAVIVSHNSPFDDPKVGPRTILAADAIIDAIRAGGVRRVIWVGGAGSLIAPDGRRVIDTLGMPPWARSAIWAMAAHLMHLQTIDDLDWSFLSPAIGFAAGARTGRFRTALDDLIFDADGASVISFEDFAVAAIDELER
ncbi:MAG: rmlD substrate binding domain protein, partial [Sphingomonas bacterium]|nr:rmlD substrate binding domain protein [Sphingomonas bacterium]